MKISDWWRIGGLMILISLIFSLLVAGDVVNIFSNNITNNVTGSGTVDYVPKWGVNNTLTDSAMYESAGVMTAAKITATDTLTGTLLIDALNDVNVADDLYVADFVGVGVDPETTSAVVTVKDNALQSQLAISNEGTGNYHTKFDFYTYSNTASTRGIFTSYRSRGSSASPSNVVAGDRLFSIIGTGYYSGYKYPFSMEIEAGDNWGLNSYHGYMYFMLAGTGDTSRSQMVTFDGDGYVGINVNNPDDALDVDGDVDIDNGGLDVENNVAFHDDLTVDNNLIVKYGNATIHTDVTVYGKVNFTNLKRSIAMNYYTASCGSGGGVPQELLYGRDCDDSATEYMIYSVKMPDTYNDNKTVEFVLDIWNTVAVTRTNHTIAWRIRYNGAKGDGTTIPAYRDDYYLFHSFPANASLNTGNELRYNLTGIEQGDYVTIILYRYGGHADDNLTGDLFVSLNPKLEYYTDTIGVEI